MSYSPLADPYRYFVFICETRPWIDQYKLDFNDLGIPMGWSPQGWNFDSTDFEVIKVKADLDLVKAVQESLKSLPTSIMDGGYRFMVVWAPGGKDNKQQMYVIWQEAK